MRAALTDGVLCRSERRHGRLTCCDIVVVLSLTTAHASRLPSRSLNLPSGVSHFLFRSLDLVPSGPAAGQPLFLLR